MTRAHNSGVGRARNGRPSGPVPAPDDAGTVLIVTLLTLALMSAVALGLLVQLRETITRTGGLSARAQADLYALGARDFAQAQLDGAAALDSAALGVLVGTNAPIVLPFDNGSVVLSVRDGSHCLRLGALGGGGVDATQGQLASLLQMLDTPPTQATQIAAAAADWVDADSQPRPGGAEDGTYLSRPKVFGAGPYRTANTLMVSPTEMRAVDGMTEAVFRAVVPHLCVGPADAVTRFNINSADIRHAPVLAALIGGDSAVALATAQQLIAQRPSGGYTRDTLLAAPVLQDGIDAAFDPDTIIFSHDRIVAEAVITFASETRHRLFAFSGLDKKRAQLTYQDWGADALALSRLPALPTETTGDVNAAETPK